MKIKNILALGLIAVVSGISTAQTYNATAGTNGITDIQSDYAQATGDGASVSVDVPLEFELPKKVAIAINTGAGLPVNSMFDGITSSVSNTSRLLDLTPYPNSSANITHASVSYAGGIYTNTPVTVTVDGTDFIHESDPTSILEAYNGIRLGKHDGSNIYEYGTGWGKVLPWSKNLDTTAIQTEGGKFAFYFDKYVYLDSVDASDRAGKYISLATITVSTL